MTSSGAKRQAERGVHLTRQQVAERLGVSVSSVRRLEGTLLHPKLDARGARKFDPDEVDAIARYHHARHRPTRDHSALAGDIASRAFQMFEEQADLNEIVIALRVMPHVVRALYEEWSTDLETGRMQQQAERDERELERQIASAMAPFVGNTTKRPHRP